MILACKTRSGFLPTTFIVSNCMHPNLDRISKMLFFPDKDLGGLKIDDTKGNFSLVFLRG